jgi:hypothetical protein
LSTERLGHDTLFAPNSWLRGCVGGRRIWKPKKYVRSVDISQAHSLHEHYWPPPSTCAAAMPAYANPAVQHIHLYSLPHPEIDKDVNDDATECVSLHAGTEALNSFLRSIAAQCVELNGTITIPASKSLFIRSSRYVSLLYPLFSDHKKRLLKVLLSF